MVSRPALTPERVLRRIEWRVIRRLDGRLQGDYRTLFRGEGIDVIDLREYQPGDDLRRVDWNVTARTDVPHVREYVEDREVTAWLVLDRSASMDFGPVERRKKLVVIEVAATVAQLLARGGNRIGAVLFDAGVEEIVPPGHGRNQVLRILQRLMAEPGATPAPGGPAAVTTGAAAAPATPVEAAAGETRAGWRARLPRLRPAGPAAPQRRPTDLAVPLRAMLGIAKRRSLVVVVSDLIGEPGWEQPLALLARRHDVVVLQVADPREHDLPSVGMIYVEDPETGEQIFVDTDDERFTARLREAAAERQAAVTAAVRAAGTDLFTVSTDEDLVRALARVSELRRRRR